MFSKTRAEIIIAEARRDDKMLVFNRNNPKSGKSRWRYEFYKHVTSFEEFDALCSEKSEYRAQKLSPEGVVQNLSPTVESKASKADLVNDV